MKKVGDKLSYDPKTILGRGSFGIVFKGLLESKMGINSNSRGSIKTAVAVKRFQNSEIEAISLQREVLLMQRAGDHPNILRYICTEKDDDFMYEIVGIIFFYIEKYHIKL